MDQQPDLPEDITTEIVLEESSNLIQQSHELLAELEEQLDRSRRSLGDR